MNIKTTLIGSEPISPSDAADYLQIDEGQEPKLISRMIAASRAFVERYCGISIVEKEIDILWPRFEKPLRLPYGPVKSIDVFKIDGVDVAPGEDLNRIELDSGSILKATYTAGMDNIPEDLTQCIYDILKIFYDNRSTAVDMPSTIISSLEKHSKNLFL